jgi:hypothetical protein
MKMSMSKNEIFKENKKRKHLECTLTNKKLDIYLLLKYENNAKN